MIRRIAPSILAAAAAMSLLAACSTGTAEETEPTAAAASDGSPASLVPDDVRTAGELLIGNSPVYPPMSYLPEGDEDEANRIGFDIDLAKAIAEQLDLTPVFERQNYEQYLPSLSTGRLDIVLSAMQDLEERRETATFVDYYYTGPQLFTTADRTDLKSVEDLCGGTVVVGIANVGDQDTITAASEEFCADDPITVTTSTDNAAALVALQQGRADANIRGAESISYLMNELEPDTYITVGEPLRQIPSGIAIDKGNTEMVAAISAAMDALIADGTYAEIGETWNLSDLLLPGLMVNGEEE